MLFTITYFLFTIVLIGGLAVIMARAPRGRAPFDAARPMKLRLGPVLLIVFLLIVDYEYWYSRQPDTAQRLAESIRLEVPPHATRAQVGAWFRRHHIDYYYLGSGFDPHDEAIVASAIPVQDIGSMVGQTLNYESKYAVNGDCWMNIYFFFDKKGVLIKYLTGTLCAGMCQGI